MKLKIQFYYKMRVIENPSTGETASETHARRKAERLALKPEKKRKSIPKESPKRKKERPIYTKLKNQHLAEHPECEARLPGCDGQSTECHHSAKRGANYLNTSTFQALCSSCHRITEQELSAEKDVI